MRVGVQQDVRRGAEGHQLVQHLPDVSAFGGAGIQLAVTESAGAALSVAVIGIRVYYALHGKLGHVHLAAFHVFAPFQNDGLETLLEQFESRKHTGRARPNNQDGRPLRYVLVRSHPVRLESLSLAVGLHAVAVQDVLPGVYAAAGYFHVHHLVRLYAQGLGSRLAEHFLREFLSNLLRYLKFLHLRV